MRFVTGAALGLLSYILVLPYLGALDGYYAPVVTQTAITQTEALGETRTRIWGGFQKVRNCDFEDLEFRLGVPGSSTRADLVLEEGSKQRDAGWEDFGPWVVQLDADQLANRSFAIVYHQCYLGGLPLPWFTETRFYP